MRVIKRYIYLCIQGTARGKANNMNMALYMHAHFHTHAHENTELYNDGLH